MQETLSLFGQEVEDAAEGEATLYINERARY